MATKKLWQQGMIFGGEMMKCGMCSKEQKSDPKIESGWTAVTIDGKRTYICPDCWTGIDKHGSSK